jgi:hypothetical protein
MATKGLDSVPTEMPIGPWLAVIGTHRSGTSALTGALGAMGFALPQSDDRLEWEESNPDHFESVGMLLLDEEILRRFGGNWQRPPTLPSGWETTIETRSFDVEARKTAHLAFSETGPLVWKDPRACLLLPYWRRIVTPLAAVFVWRDPLAVARSLEKRNGFNLFHGVALWERYNQEALSGMKDMDVFATSYESLIEDPKRVFGQIATWLDTLPQFEAWRGGWNIDRASSAIEPQHRHQAGDPTWPFMESQLQLLEVLRELDGPYPSFESGPLPAVSPWSAGLLDMAGRVTIERALNEVLASRSWQVTKPLRYLSTRMHRYS